MLSVAMPPFGPRNVTVRALASTLVTVTTASVSWTATALSLTCACETNAKLPRTAAIAMRFMCVSLELGADVDPVLREVRRAVGAAEVHVLRVHQEAREGAAAEVHAQAGADVVAELRGRLGRDVGRAV